MTGHGMAWASLLLTFVACAGPGRGEADDGAAGARHPFELPQDGIRETARLGHVPLDPEAVPVAAIVVGRPERRLRDPVQLHVTNRGSSAVELELVGLPGLREGARMALARDDTGEEEGAAQGGCQGAPDRRSAADRRRGRKRPTGSAAGRDPRRARRHCPGRIGVAPLG